MLVKNGRRLALAVVFLLAACGGGDTDAPFQTTIGPDGQVQIDAPIENVAGMSAACEAIGNVSLALTRTMTGQAGDTADFIATARAQAPGELHDAIDAMGSGLADIEAFYAEVGNPMTDPDFYSDLTPADEDRLDAIFNNDEMDAAFEELSAWATAECTPFAG